MELYFRRHDSRYNDIQNNDTQNNDPQNNDTENNEYQHNNKNVTQCDNRNTPLNIYYAACQNLPHYVGCHYLVSLTG
jgi:hypothetical protein